MLELAIAEAYRPGPRPRPPSTLPPRPASFATNPNARTRTPDFSLRLRTPSELTRTTSTTSHSRSFISFIARRTRPGSMLNDRTVIPSDAVRTDSVLSQSTAIPKAHAAEESGDIGRQLPELPHRVPLPPQEELEHFDAVLQDAIENLQNSSSLPLDRDLASVMLEHLAHVADIASCVATSWPEFWSMLVHAGKLINSVLPAGDVVVRNVLVRSLAQVAGRWNKEQRQSTMDVAQIVGETFEEAIKARGSMERRMCEMFAHWLSKNRKGLQHGRVEGEAEKVLRILALDTSRGFLAALTHALVSNGDPEVHLSVLSPSDKISSPPLEHTRLHITTYPTNAIGTASQNVDILLLTADCIDSRGDARCQNDALGTAVCVKTLSPGSKVVMSCGVDNVTTAMERRTTSDDVGVVKDAFESVTAEFVDMYVTEAGALKVDGLEWLAKEATQLGRYILGAGD